MDFSRNSKKTLYVVAGFYVLVGFVLAIASVVGGDRLGTFLGFLIISGALVGAVMLRAIMHLGEQADELAHALDEMRHCVLSGEASVSEQLREIKEAAGVRMVDLTTFGSGDPSSLTAATLDRDAFPRLMKAMDDAPPPLAAASESVEKVVGQAELVLPERDGPATKNLLRQWKVAVREGDLAECRRVLSTMVDVATREELVPLEAQLAALTARVERKLRSAFSAHVRNRDFAGAIAVGNQITELLPGTPVARDFEAVRSQLHQKQQSTLARTAWQG